MRQNSTIPAGQRFLIDITRDFAGAAQSVTLRRPGTVSGGVKGADTTRIVRALGLPVSPYAASQLNLEGYGNLSESVPHHFLFDGGTDVKINDIVDNYDGWQWKMLAPMSTPYSGIGQLVQTVGIRNGLALTPAQAAIGPLSLEAENANELTGEDGATILISEN